MNCTFSQLVHSSKKYKSRVLTANGSCIFSNTTQSIKSTRTEMISNMIRIAIFMLFITSALQHSQVNDGPVNCHRHNLCASDTKLTKKYTQTQDKTVGISDNVLHCWNGKGNNFYSPSGGTIVEFRVHFRIQQ